MSQSLFQVTLALLKPDIAGNSRIVQNIEKFVLTKKFFIVKRKRLRWNKAKAEEFYSQHKDRFFYDRLISFMSSGPIFGLILAKENAINDWRNLLGPTKVYEVRLTVRFLRYQAIIIYQYLKNVLDIGMID